MDKLYIERVRVFLKRGFEVPLAPNDSQPAEELIPSLVNETPRATDALAKPTKTTPTNASSLASQSTFVDGTLHNKIQASASENTVPIDTIEEPATNELISRVVPHSMATALSASSTPTQARSASFYSVSHPNKYLLPHLMSRHTSIELISEVPPQKVNHRPSQKEELMVLYSLSSFLFLRKCYPAAIEVGEIALAEYRGTNDEVGLASILHILGMITSEQSNLNKARLFFEEELKIRLQAQGATHHEVVTLLDQLGWLMRRTGEHFGSLKYFKQSLALQREQGIRDLLTLSTLNGLGSVQTELGNLVQAREYFNEALALATSFGLRDPAVAQTLHNIGNNYEIDPTESINIYIIRSFAHKRGKVERGILVL